MVHMRCETLFSWENNGKIRIVSDNDLNAIRVINLSGIFVNMFFFVCLFVFLF